MAIISVVGMCNTTSPIPPPQDSPYSRPLCMNSKVSRIMEYSFPLSARISLTQSDFSQKQKAPILSTHGRGVFKKPLATS